jgi:drug/metabolite transporter (DMT)-like permease
MTFSTALIMTNKYIMKTFHFNWPITLSSYHFFCTYSLLEIMCRMGLFQRGNDVPISARWQNAFFNVCGIVFMNFNLKMNSVGFYQLSKLCCIPVMVLTNYVLYNKKTPSRTVATLVLIVIGIAMFSVNEVSFNIPGTVVAVIAVIATTASQLNTGIISNKYNTFGSSLQHVTALPMAILGSCAAFVIEILGKNTILQHSFQSSELILCLLTGGLALISNVCAFALIGKQSAVTYQVVGHAKTIIIFVIGLVFMDSNEGETTSQTIKKIIGLSIGMLGTILYTIFEMQDKAKAKLLEAKEQKPEVEELTKVAFKNVEENDEETNKEQEKDEA